MELVDGLGYVALAVPDLESSLDFYRRVAHLKVSERGTKTAFLTGGSQHHWLRLDETGSVGVSMIALQLSGKMALDEVTNRLDARKVRWQEAKDLEGDRVGDAIHFTDPGGLEIELFTDMVTLPVAPQPFIQMDRVLHAVWSTPSFSDSCAFYSEVLGLKESDWIERTMVFMRAGNRYHHSVGIVRSDKNYGQLDHFCILVDQLDDVMKAKNVALRRGAKLRYDLIRHAASGSVSTYITDPINSIAVEFCANHRRIDEEGYRPRILPASPATFDVWKVSPDEDDELTSPTLVRVIADLDRVQLSPTITAAQSS